jgi:hypothetical protein
MPHKWTLLGLCACLAASAGCDVSPGGQPRPGLQILDGRSLSVVDGGAWPESGAGPRLDLDAKPKPKLDSGTKPKLDSGTKPKLDSGTKPSGDYDYTKHIKWHTIPSTGKSCNTASYGQFYCDVMTHTKSPYYGSDTLTNVHETQHFMAHENDGTTPASDKFIYFRNGKGAFFPEPTMTTQGIYSSIKLKGTTYNTYIAGRPGQKLGENIVDEWRAYLTEEIAAIQIAKIKGQTSVSGLVLGGVEFLYYNAAMLHALHTKEPSFLANNPQAKAVFAMMAEETKLWTIDQGVDKGLFFSSTNAKAKATLAEIATGANGAHIRSTIKAIYGPVWAKRVLGIN